MHSSVQVKYEVYEVDEKRVRMGAVANTRNFYLKQQFHNFISNR